MLYSPSADASFSHSTRTIYLALELSRRSWLVALHAPDAAKIELHRLPAGDGQAVLDLFARIRTRVERRTGVRPQVSCCYEAGRDGFWLHRLLEAHGVSSHVMDPSSLQVDRRARRVKTDRLDAQALLRALMAWSRGEPKVCSMVRPPSPDEEDARRPSRERATLLQERIRLVNRIQGLCATQGIDDYEPLRPDRRPRLTQLVRGMVGPCRRGWRRRSPVSSTGSNWCCASWPRSRRGAMPKRRWRKPRPHPSSGPCCT